MTALKNTTALTLKFKLETALYKSRQEMAMNQMKHLLVEKGIFHETKWDRTMEEACEAEIQERMATRYNITLWGYYVYGEKLFYHEQKPRWENKTQGIAAFIYRYFKHEPHAVHLLENVTPTNFNICASDKAILVEERPPLPTVTPGRSDLRADDLWHPLQKHPEITQNDEESEVEHLSIEELFRGHWNETPSSPKRQRTTSPTPSDPETVTSQARDINQPRPEFKATESFWDDYLQQDYAVSLEPVDPTRKRKFRD
jgi:hypothetical protein